MRSFRRLLLRQLNNEHSTVYDLGTLNFSPYLALHKEVLSELNADREGVYLDAGCGTGNFYSISRERLGESVIGVDFSPGMARKAKMKGEQVILADLQNLPLKENCLEGIVCINVFYQLPDPKKFLKEAYRILKSNTRIVIATPDEKAGFFAFALEFFKDVLRNPVLLNTIPYQMRYYRINKAIIRANPGFYSKSILEKLFANFEILEIRKTYVDQDWLLVARKP
jgi:ubiquinone/menaquinone biosynthesis C-methylase UbiE